MQKKPPSTSQTTSILDCSPSPARFVQGCIMHHVITMAGTGAIGLMAVFAVDLLNFFYISHLKDPILTAATAFATSLNFVQTAVSLGMSIGLGACTGHLIGACQHTHARQITSAFLLAMLIFTTCLGLITAFFASPLLSLLGAKGDVLTHATVFTHIVSPALPLIALGMALSSLLRAIGDAKRAMRVTLTGAFFTAVIDPVLIFGFHLGLEGAAISTVLSRAVIVLSGFLNLRSYTLLEYPQYLLIPTAIRNIGSIALPAIGTNLATPVSMLFVTHAMAHFGLDAVSGQAAIDRIIPVAFSFVFALTGSVGPIMAQNLGAGHIDRVKDTFLSALKLTILCVGLTWLILALGHKIILHIFHIQGEGIAVVKLFCCWTVASYMFIGFLFVSNTAFNNLGYPLYSTGFNWGRATLGTIPFVTLGATYGPQGIMIGQALGVILTGISAMLTAFSVIHRLNKIHQAKHQDALSAKTFW